MRPKRNKTGRRGRKRLRRSSTHHNKYVNINLADIVHSRKGRGKGRTSGKTTTQTTKEPLITRFVSTFASDGKTQLINQAQPLVLGQQQPNVLQQQRNNTQGLTIKNNTVEEKMREMRDIYKSPIKPNKTQEEPIRIDKWYCSVCEI